MRTAVLRIYNFDVHTNRYTRVDAARFVKYLNNYRRCLPSGFQHSVLAAIELPSRLVLHLHLHAVCVCVWSIWIFRFWVLTLRRVAGKLYRHTNNMLIRCGRS